MARKSNKTAHVLNLLSGGEPEKETQQPQKPEAETAAETAAAKAETEPEKEEAEKKAREEAEDLRQARLASLNGISEEALGRLAVELGINPADCKDQADVLKKVKAALKKG